MAKSQRITFTGSDNHELAARLDLPDGPIAAFALFAHCFTCSKDFIAARRIAAGLAERGFAVLRFDFTGLGSSQGDFANTNFSSNVEDILLAVDFLREHYRAPELLVGHSLGGAAVLSAAPEIPELKAVVTIAAPAEAEHVSHNLLPHLETIDTAGEAEVELGGRNFTIRRQFLDDIRDHKVLERVKRLKTPLLVLHAPTDKHVGIENAAAIFEAARHPKSFVSLEQADHLLSNPNDAGYVADVIAAWASRYVDVVFDELEEVAAAHLVVSETQQGRYQAIATRGQHRLLVDEPVTVGGLDSGPTPYDYLAIALGACTTMTLRMYAEHKEIDIGRITVEVDHGKVDVDHCSDCAGAVAASGGRIDRFERRILVDGGATPELAARLLEIADKCPVHRTLHGDVAIVTRLVQRPDPAIITQV
ncbi:MAG: bifunctional alpha/beta hydrolase/OsmC family protein [Alphaproteobacteria bacterium]